MADDDLILSAQDLAGIFGMDEQSKSEDLAKTIADLFEDDEDEAAPAPAPAPIKLAPPPPMPKVVPKAPPPPAEPEIQEPEHQGMSEEQWRASPEYAAFKQQVIERHLRKKAAEEAAAQSQAEAEAAAVEASRLEIERRKAESLERQAAQKKAAPPPPGLAKPPSRAADAAASGRGLPLPPSVPGSPAPSKPPSGAAGAASSGRALPLPPPILAGAPAPAPPAAAPEAAAPVAVPLGDAEKDAKLKAYLAGLKAKVAGGHLAPLELHGKHLAPKLSAASEGLQLGIEEAKTVALLFELTREELCRHVGDVIGKRAAQTMMKKTLVKALKPHEAVLGRAAVDAKGELKPDGQLDEDKLARAIYALPADKRLSTVQAALYELIEMRFIACELGLGHKVKAVAVSKTLNALEAYAKKKGLAQPLVRWYFDDVIPSTSLADSDDGGF